NYDESSIGTCAELGINSTTYYEYFNFENEYFLGRDGSTTCGDGMHEGIEQCDDGNTNDDDGCSSYCVVEGLDLWAVGEFDYNNEIPVLSNEFGMIEFLEPVTLSSAITGKNLFDMITIEKDRIFVDTSHQTTDNPGFNIAARVTFYNTSILPSLYDNVTIYGFDGNPINVTILSYDPLIFEVDRFGDRVGCIDLDNDGFIALAGYYCTGQLDCDDNSDNVYPGAEEICDGVDNDCNGLVDEGDVCHLCHGNVLKDIDKDGLWDISSCCDLHTIRDDLYGDYELRKNINCRDTVNWANGEGFKPIGDNNNPFFGSLDGNGHVITGLNIGSRPYAGLFGSLMGVIQNLGLEDVNIEGGWITGGFAGILAHEGTLTNSYISGIITSPNYIREGPNGNLGYALGGLFGYTRSARFTINNSYSAVELNGNVLTKDPLVATENNNGARGTELINVYWNKELIGLSSTGLSGIAMANVEGKTIAEMKQWSSYVGFDFENTWVKVNGGYPYLRWQY
ncbi:DUF4215 domain-containing protein, partial [archaeon]|nr:DUF4215 domain-containing protein [archaeon]